jgi:hypothetical protein
MVTSVPPYLKMNKLVAMVILKFNIAIISISILTNYNANLQVFNFQCYKGHCFEPEHKQYMCQMQSS